MHVTAALATLAQSGAHDGTAEKARWASITLLPAYTNGSPSWKTKNGAPFPTRLPTATLCTLFEPTRSKFEVRKVRVRVDGDVTSLIVPICAGAIRWFVAIVALTKVLKSAVSEPSVIVLALMAVIRPTVVPSIVISCPIAWPAAVQSPPLRPIEPVGPEIVIIAISC